MKKIKLLFTLGLSCILGFTPITGYAQTNLMEQQVSDDFEKEDLQKEILAEKEDLQNSGFTFEAVDVNELPEGAKVLNFGPLQFASRTINLSGAVGF